MSVFVLVHSPLVGPGSWRPVAAELTGRGHQAYVPTLRDAMAGGPPYYAQLATTVVDQVTTEAPVVLVAHSGAGAVLPAVADALRAPVGAAVFVDALLPHGGQSWFDTAPAELAEQLRDLADGGLLPPWHSWFPPGTVAALVPDDVLRQELLAEMPHLPLGYFAEVAPELPDWQPDRCGYLQLSEGYAATAAQAAAAGWRVEHLPSDHLATVTRPGAVTDELVALASP